MRPLSLATLLLTIAPGCWFKPCSDEIVSDSVTIQPTWDDLADALDASGELTEEGCAALCGSNLALNRIDTLSCAFEDPDAVTSDTASPAPWVVCEGTGTPFCGGGRHHASIAARARCDSPDPVAANLAASALAEATSVKAFVALAGELEAFGAPAELVARCRQAATDEVAHARLLGAAARALGAEVPRPAFQPTPARGLLDFAIENAVEGCVHETWAAAVAAWQAGHAADGDLRATYARIARDEVRHAELAWAIHAWIQAQLGPAERARVAAARAEAVRALQSRPRWAEDAVAATLGLPGAADSGRMLDALDAEIWRQAA